MAMVAADGDGIITAWNKSAAEIFDIHGQEILGANWNELIPVEERKVGEELLLACLHEGKNAEFEFTLRHERGTCKKLAAIVTPIRNEAGGQVGGLACVRDITNRAVLQDRLAQKTKMAALGEMAGALSHHFNNILGGVVTSVDFALASGEPLIQAKVMEKTATALSRATGLVENLLAFAEGDYRDATLCDLGEVLIEVIEEVEPKLHEIGIGLEVDIKLFPVISVPRSAMKTVINNLTDNALEAMCDGGVLTLKAEADDKLATISIGDTGCGLDERTLMRVFEPFYTTKSRGTDRDLSRGLGLAVAHGILKVLHGFIQVTSTPGQGTIFEICIPVNPPANPACAANEEE